ncbi:MAG: FkbM family methyltransferase [Candidatus Synoicihabitans palmerolidicus]|nr:FkbM family methyltransferase [Candidatus Synoicihabitans palmerolidicus]
MPAGANDGSRNDPLAPLIRPLQWRGTLIEPRGTFIPQLLKRYQDYPLVRVVQVAVAAERATAQLYSIAADAPNAPTFVDGLGTLDRARIESACRDLSIPVQFIREEMVNCLPWEEIDTAFPIQEVEVLIIDTEGFGIQLLNLWDWQKSQPRVVHFEHSCAPVADHTTILEQLRNLSYELVIERDNTTAYIPHN